jgi:hypothetical protein
MMYSSAGQGKRVRRRLAHPLLALVSHSPQIVPLSAMTLPSSVVIKGLLPRGCTSRKDFGARLSAPRL